eukprot:TRINITY_DN276_c0_g2_i1.p1 TRINITY_DN276_c0_g2~~TRINITY_DN276_c0_g2_i1.p1  ORF type:complete len:1466 (+),score=392.54 TRINITY_DN276_c0_g2_i1:181-4398(+)
MEKFSEGYKIFGFNRTKGGYTYREWLPNAKQVFLVGEFNGWQNTTPLVSEGFGRWKVDLPDQANGEPMVPHKSQLKVRLETHNGQWHDRVPAWIKLAWQDRTTNLFNGVFWEPPAAERYTARHPRPAKPENLKIYEAHVGMASFDPKVATYTEFARDVLPRVKRMGYNAVQLMAIAEHAHYGCFGYHVTSFFAPASRSGTPEELKELVDTAHGLGIVVLVDLVHAHMSSNTMDGIAEMDGTDHCYTHGGPKGHHSEWDSKLFDYSKHEVLRFLLSNVRWWLEEYGFDGFRFDGVTSMLYHSHGIGKGYTGGYHEYFGGDADIDSHAYLMLANDLIHTLVPSAVTVGEDVSGMPTLCRPVAEGGFGFDYRLAMAIPDMFIKLLKECSDHDWGMGHITFNLTNRRWKEKVIAYAESHDQAIVGDKTVAFWLMDAEMYTGMSIVQSPQPSLVIDRGLSLHKMIRLLVLGLGGEGYLNFMGNEFGHPEWIDFPTERNGWSYQHCRRRWDLADMDHLRYQYFQNFDELMQATEHRFGWLGAEHQYVTLKDDNDKVIAFERGDVFFVFNLHPTNSYTDYQIGLTWKEPMLTVLDSDEGRFGGHMRLEHGHANAFQPLGSCHGRPNSIKMYLPSRTAQVLVKERLLQGGVRVRVDAAFLANSGLSSAKGLSLELRDGADSSKVVKKVSFDAAGSVALSDQYCSTFALMGSDGKMLKCGASADGLFRVFFPGSYAILGTGYIAVDDAAAAAAPVAAAPAAKATAKTGGYVNGTAAPAAPAPAPAPAPAAVEKAAAASDAGSTKTASASGAAGAASVQSAKEEELKGEAAAGGLGQRTASTTSFHNMPDTLSDCGGGMQRVFSLSALDLPPEPEQAVQLRERLESYEGVERAARYGARHLSTPVVIVTSELNPWSKTGGLGMVAGSYAYEFAQRGHRTMAIAPRYGEYANATYIGFAKIWLDGRENEVKFFHLRQDYGPDKACDFIFVDHDCFRRPQGMYCDSATGKEYEDNVFRFALLSLAALEAPLVLNLGGSTYGQDVMFIANDWQTGLLPVYMHYKYRRNGTYMGARTMLVIHNLGYQGKYKKSKHPVESHLGLPGDAINDLQGEDLNMGDDCINLLQAGVKTCDRVLTVSPNYANEIQSPEGGFGMHEILKGKGAMLRMAGILNGIGDEWSPITDPHIPVNYGPADFEMAKARCKRELQLELGLHPDPNVALLGFCGRLCYQKGIHLITGILGWLLQDQGNGVNGRVQIIMMGKGDSLYAQQLSEAEGKNRGRVCGYVGFDPHVEHRMMAGCDFILMPSQYEPCGLPQMYAQQYATLPVVHETGGLKDSVHGLWDVERDRTKATGFLFNPMAEDPLKERLYQALHIFHHDKELFRQMQTNAIKSDYYWPRALDEYEKHIDYTLEDPPCR